MRFWTQMELEIQFSFPDGIRFWFWFQNWFWKSDLILVWFLLTKLVILTGRVWYLPNISKFGALKLTPTLCLVS